MAVHYLKPWSAVVALLVIGLSACGTRSPDEIDATAAATTIAQADGTTDLLETATKDPKKREKSASTRTTRKLVEEVDNSEDWTLDGSLGVDTAADSSSSAPTTTTVAAPAPDQPPAVAIDPSADLSFKGAVQVATVTAPSVYAYAALPADKNPAAADWAFSNQTQFGNPQVFLVTEDHGDWLKVSLPTRPNGTEGFVHKSDVSLASNQYRAVVDLSDYSVTVLRGPDVIVQTKAVLGKSSTPTPTGRFFINELLRRPNPEGAYGPFILGLSARSEALDTFNGGEALIAVHGTNKPWLVGSNASNGCIRIPNDLITLLANEVPLGTPIEIIA